MREGEDRGRRSVDLMRSSRWLMWEGLKEEVGVEVEVDSCFDLGFRLRCNFDAHDDFCFEDDFDFVFESSFDGFQALGIGYGGISAREQP